MKISVVIPTYNRFEYLLNLINTVKNQTYKNYEIIVVNDCSTQKEYYTYDWEENNIKIIHMKENSKSTFGYGCVGYIRNKGVELAKGDYIAFCDDDDIWFHNKLELQVKALEKSNCKMCCTDGLIGNGIYDKNESYKKYNAEYYYKTLQNIYQINNSKLIEKGFPDIWNLEFINIHNCIITSSVLIEKELLKKIDGMPFDRRGQDYKCWLKALKHTDCIYLKDICFYYDLGHGDGQNH